MIVMIVLPPSDVADAAEGRLRIIRRPRGDLRRRSQEDLAAAECPFMAWCTIGKTNN
jgi:hypothetical protein